MIKIEAAQRLAAGYAKPGSSPKQIKQAQIMMRKKYIKEMKQNYKDWHDDPERQKLIMKSIESAEASLAQMQKELEAM